MKRTAPIRVQHTWSLFRQAMHRRVRLLRHRMRHGLRLDDRRLQQLLTAQMRMANQHLRMKLAMRRDQNDGQWIQSRIDHWVDSNDRSLTRRDRIAGRLIRR